MNDQDIQKKIDSLNYWDMLVDEIVVDNFLSNVTISYFNERRISFKFCNCYTVIFNHCLEYKKLLKADELPPCFFRSIDVEEIKSPHQQLFKVKLDAYPINLEIVCELIDIY